MRAWLARLDHGGVYLLIAGTYTPFGLLVMSTEWAVPVLSVVWGGALVAILLKLVWVHAPKWRSATIGVGLGWVGAAAFSQLLKVQLLGLSAPGSGSSGTWIPRALPRADACRRRLPLRSDRIFCLSARVNPES